MELSFHPILKGKRQPVLRQLADISWAAMNHGDTFILDVRSHIFVWTGKDSNRMERLQASKVCRGTSYSDSSATFASKVLLCKATFHTFSLFLSPRKRSKRRMAAAPSSPSATARRGRSRRTRWRRSRPFCPWHKNSRWVQSAIANKEGKLSTCR